MENLGTLFVKLILLGISSPFWVPFLKAVWEEFELALAEEGGVFGKVPGPERLREIQWEKRRRPDPLVHEPWMTHERRRAGRRVMRTHSAQPTASAGPPPTGF